MRKIQAKQIAPFSVLATIALVAAFVPALPLFTHPHGVYTKAAIAWIRVSTVLVFLMTPGLAFFYGNPGCGWSRYRGMAIVVGFSLGISFLIFRVINFMLPLRLPARYAPAALNAMQHHEKYLQGMLPVSYLHTLEAALITKHL